MRHDRQAWLHERPRAELSVAHGRFAEAIEIASLLGWTRGEKPRKAFVTSMA